MPARCRGTLPRRGTFPKLRGGTAETRRGHVPTQKMQLRACSLTKPKEVEGGLGRFNALNRGDPLFLHPGAFSRANANRRFSMIVKNAALLFGVVFLIVGILGFVPGVTTNEMLLGIFHVNAAHNVV